MYGTGGYPVYKCDGGINGTTTCRRSADRSEYGFKYI